MRQVVVIGSGFAGSMMAILLQRLGLECAVVDRERHPRFAIGESSTPTANFILASLADRYDLPWLAPLAKYGSWQAAYPDVGCGLKRGFSYFHHQPGRLFQPRGDHANELLVAASDADSRADTQWLRSDVDALFAAQAAKAGIELLEATEVAGVSRNGGRWEVAVRPVSAPGSKPARQRTLKADWIIDASGAGRVLARRLDIPDASDALRTRSAALYTHLDGVRPWRDVYLAAGGAAASHPFDCDDAAVHHLLDEGWMWMLRFNHGAVSVGFALDGAGEGRSNDWLLPPEMHWRSLVARYPSLALQLAPSRLSRVPGRLFRTGRMQRCVSQSAGDGWVMLPHTAGFIDPLHSTGIAHSLSGIERLAALFQQHGADSEQLAAPLAGYSRRLRSEFQLIDQLVSGCYAARRCFRLFSAWSMLYFAAATTYERRRAEPLTDRPCGFLLADDRAWRSIVDELEPQLYAAVDATQCAAAGDAATEDAFVAAFERTLAAKIAPYNHVGLCDPAAQNMYRHTTAPDL